MLRGGGRRWRNLLGGGRGLAKVFVAWVARFVALGQVLPGDHATVCADGENLGFAVQVLLSCDAEAAGGNLEGLILDRLDFGPTSVRYDGVPDGGAVFKDAADCCLVS